MAHGLFAISRPVAISPLTMQLNKIAELAEAS